jgi:hypothetical protein
MRPILARVGTVAVTCVLAGVIAAAGSGVANAATTGSHGQPNQSCGSTTAPNTPGNSSSAPGSAFNPGGQAGSVYAGEQPQNSNNPNAVSQYDVACFQVSQR